MTTEIIFDYANLGETADPAAAALTAAGDNGTQEAAAGADTQAPVLPSKPAEMGPVETLAKDMGWKPEAEYAGEPGTWRPAADFIKQGAKINSSRKHTIDDLTKSVEELKVFNERVYKAENARLKEQLTQLQADRKHAIRDSDVELVEQLDAKIGQVSDQIATPPPVSSEAEQTVNPVFEDWLSKNEWYGVDAEMTELAESITRKAKDDGLPFTAILKKIDKAAAELYPDKILKPSKAAAEPQDSVLGPTRGAPDATAANKTMRLSDLPEEAQASAKRFERQGIMSVAQYIKSYQAAL